MEREDSFWRIASTGYIDHPFEVVLLALTGNQLTLLARGKMLSIDLLDDDKGRMMESRGMDKPQTSSKFMDEIKISQINLHFSRDDSFLYQRLADRMTDFFFFSVKNRWSTLGKFWPSVLGFNIFLYYC